MIARRKNTWRAIAAAFVVAVGVALVWGLATGWVLSFFKMVDDLPDVIERINVTQDGTPVISAERYARNITLSRRTLEGKPFPDDYDFFLSAAYLQPAKKPGRIVHIPYAWPQGGRIAGFTDGRSPPASWYMVREDRSGGHCYFAGYEALSKLPIGYIGRNGFRPTLPEADDQFSLADNDAAHLSPIVSSTQYLNEYSVVLDRTLRRASPADIPQWLVYVASADRIWEVDLRQRSVRSAFDVPEVVSVGYLRALATTAGFSATEGASTKPAVSPQGEAVPGNAKERPTADAIGVRTSDRLVLYTASEKRHEFVLPANTPNEMVVVYWIAPQRLLIEYKADEWAGGPVQRLVWSDAAGKVERQIDLKLAGPISAPPWRALWIFSGVLPISIVWLIGILIGGPLVLLQMYWANSYRSALAISVGLAWPPMLVVLLVSAVLCWLTVRLQRKYRRPATPMWAAFVFLLGLPGFVAYLVEHRRAKLDVCPECGGVVPRDRDTCADCGREFAPAAPIGTEIFA